MSEFAEFRAMRETLGLTRQDVADYAGVSLRSVKRWEDPAEENPPSEGAWELLYDTDDKRFETVRQALYTVRQSGTKAVQLTYYRTQAQYDALGRDEGPYGVANANARAIAERLRDEGVEVEWAYPDEAENIYHRGSE